MPIGVVSSERSGGAVGTYLARGAREVAGGSISRRQPRRRRRTGLLEKQRNGEILLAPEKSFAPEAAVGGYPFGCTRSRAMHIKHGRRNSGSDIRKEVARTVER